MLTEKDKEAFYRKVGMYVLLFLFGYAMYRFGQNSILSTGGIEPSDFRTF